jgi:cobalamin biosynthesis protein CobT
MVDMWRGTSLNLSRSLEWSLLKISTEKEIEDENGNKVMGRPWDMLSDFGKFTYAATCWMQLKFSDKHWFITDVVETDVMDRVRECRSLLDEAIDASDTGEVVEIARDVLKKINEEEDPVEYADPDEIEDDAVILPPQAKGSDNSAMYKKPKKGQGQEPDGPKVYQSVIDDEDLCEECGGTGTDDLGETCDVCDGDGLSEQGRERAEQQAQQPQAQQSQNGSSGGDGEDDESQGGAARPDFSNVSDEELERDNELLSRSEMLKDAAMQDLDGTDRYLIYSTEGDVIENIKDGDRVGYRQFMSETSSMVSTIKRKMARSMLSSNVSRWAGDKTRGKINPRAVFRVPLGTSKRVFRQKVQSEDFNTVVEIMVDHSGSMSGPRLSLAGRTVAVLGEVLNQLSVPFSVTGFSTGDWDEASNRKRGAPPEARKMYTRWGNLWIGVYKDYNESWAKAAPRVMQMVRNERANTYDGESLRWGTQRLLRRSEKRKILFWLNDGQPCPNGGDDSQAHRQYASDCAKDAEKAVELMAVGIQTDAVKQYYKNYVVVNNLDDLPGVCLNELDALLRKGKSLKAA